MQLAGKFLIIPYQIPDHSKVQIAIVTAVPLGFQTLDRGLFIAYLDLRGRKTVYRSSSYTHHIQPLEHTDTDAFIHTCV